MDRPIRSRSEGSPKRFHADIRSLSIRQAGGVGGGGQTEKSIFPFSCSSLFESPQEELSAAAFA